MKTQPQILAPILLGCLILLPATAAGSVGYQHPPKILEELALAPHPLALDADRARRRLLVAEPADLVPIDQLEWPERRLRNLRYYPEASAAVLGSDYAALGVCAVPEPDEAREDGRCRWFEHSADGARLRHPLFSPDGSLLVFSELHRAGLELRVATLDPAAGPPRSLAPVRLYDLLGPPCTFFPDGKSLLCRLAASGSGGPSAPSTPQPQAAGPLVRDTGSVSTLAPEAIDPSALRSSVARVYLDGRVEEVIEEVVEEVVEEGMWRRVELSPDGSLVLLERLGTSPDRFEVRRVSGPSLPPLELRKPLAGRAGDLRGVSWRDDTPATLAWFEGQAGTEGKAIDRLWSWPAPFDGAPRALFETDQRLERIRWGGRDLALVDTLAVTLAEAQEPTGSMRSRWAFEPSRDHPGGGILVARWSPSLEDPAVPLTRPVATGHELLERADDGWVWVRGLSETETPGDAPRPTLALQDPASGGLEVRWQSPDGVYERPVAMVEAHRDEVRFLAAREAEGEPANLGLCTPGAPCRSVTGWSHPLPLLAAVEHRRLEYRRRDGLVLTASLYLPPRGSADAGLSPLIFWAYPQSFETREIARRSARPEVRSLHAEPLSPMLWLARGYAVLAPDMPIVAAPGGSANDTWREQLVADAEAALGAAEATGTVDVRRTAVVGHSYGAHMAVALLAHSDLFRAGVAMAGAYNRTLTPFGFQEEPRSLWQAPEVYRRMSPILDADRITEPLLLIHGREDGQSATPPEQSERLFDALSFLGRPARLVLLPHEGHRPRGRESVLHLLWEMDRWFELHLGAAD